MSVCEGVVGRMNNSIVYFFIWVAKRAACSHETTEKAIVLTTGLLPSSACCTVLLMYSNTNTLIIHCISSDFKLFTFGGVDRENDLTLVSEDMRRETA